jgi:hypothetical protein
MSVYRIHADGSGQGRKYFYHPIKVIETLSIFNCLSGFKYDQLIKQRLDDLRSGMLDGLPYKILRSTILGRRFWKKLWHSGSIIM